MGARGSQLSRTLEYFRAGNLDEVEFVVSKGAEIFSARQKAERASVASQTKALESRPKRNRRSKAQIAEDNAKRAEAGGQTTIAQGAAAAGAPGAIQV